MQESPAEIVEKTAYEKLLERIEGFFADFEECEGYVEAVDPSLVLRGELPVNVVRMDKACKPFVSDFREFDDALLGKLQEYDALVLSLAKAVDDLMILSFKCKRVGVKSRKALKAEIELTKTKTAASIKDARSRFESLKALGLKEFPQKSYISEMFSSGENKSRNAMIDFMSGYIAYVKRYAFEPGFSGEPVYRNSLRKYSIIADKKVRMMGKALSGDPKLYATAMDMTRELKAVIDFFLSDYFDRLEDKEGKALKKGFEKAVKDWEKKYSRKIE